MNILILGGSGFIGSRVAKILRERQHSVTTPSHAELDLMRLDLDAAQRLLHGQDCAAFSIGRGRGARCGVCRQQRARRCGGVREQLAGEHCPPECGVWAQRRELRAVY